MNNLTSGYLIVYVMVLTFITMSVGLSVLSVSGKQYTHVVDDVYRQNATYGAKACASVVAEELTEDSDFGGFSNQVIFEDINSSQGQVTCTATVSDGPDDTKQAVITSYMFRFATDPNPLSHQIKVVLQPEGGGASTETSQLLGGGILAGHSGFYAMLWGQASTDRINVLGKLYGVNSTYSKLGTSTSPISKITVSNLACGDSTNWPQPCTDQPVTQWNGTTFNDIYADTCAPGQTTNLTRFKGVGLSTDCPVAKSTPSFDKQSFVNSMTNTVDASTLMNSGPGGCLDKQAIIPGYPQYGVRYYGTTINIPANTRINGSLSKYYDGTTDITTSNALQNACTLAFTGNTYLTGGIEPVVKIAISDSATENITMVLNGKVRVSEDHPGISPNSSGKLMHMISFYSNNPACSGSHVLPSASNPTCLTISQARQSAEVNSSAIALDPALLLIDAATYNFSGVTFYAYYGSVSTGCSDITIAAIGGQSVTGGCLSVGLYSNITTTGSNPTFGGLTYSDTSGSGSGYKIIDISRQ